MHVLFLNQYFYPDISSTAQIMTDLAVDLVGPSTRVTVITGRAPYIGAKTFPPRETYKGVKIIRLRTTNQGRASSAGRMLDFASFLAGSIAEVSLLRSVDIVVALSTPPLLSMVGVLKKHLSRARFVYWVQDLYPDIAVELGVLKPKSLATRTLELLSQSSLRQADAVVAIGECMAEHLKSRAKGSDNVRVIHNWADDISIFPVAHEDNWFRSTNELDKKFVVLYSGNMGRGHSFDTLLGAASQVQDNREIQFVFIGGGQKKAEIETASSQLANVSLFPYQAREDLRFSLGAADVAVIAMNDNMRSLMVPSKLYGHLASGRPIAFIGPSDSTAASIIRQCDCGRVFDHGDIAGVAGFFRELCGDREHAQAMGERGRRLLDERYRRAHGTSAFSDLLHEIARPQAAENQDVRI